MTTNEHIIRQPIHGKQNWKIPYNIIYSWVSDFITLKSGMHDYVFQNLQCGMDEVENSFLLPTFNYLYDKEYIFLQRYFILLF